MIYDFDLNKKTRDQLQPCTSLVQVQNGLSLLCGQLAHINQRLQNSRTRLKTDIGLSARLSEMLIRIQLGAPASAVSHASRNANRNLIRMQIAGRRRIFSINERGFTPVIKRKRYSCDNSMKIAIIRVGFFCVNRANCISRRSY